MVVIQEKALLCRGSWHTIVEMEVHYVQEKVRFNIATQEAVGIERTVIFLFLSLYSMSLLFF